ncbi:TetR/AcrR family transcriptional regulator [Streptomyces sp. HC44]|uniref:TetR/AcrR family transcriptional regulator n=1 Tax=Streptomyces scabichelini TaxID=2711217 RepID=A0A6G4VNG2_9ACTN|nr:TetR/AcrR family transcriptional regulator [Streptomyces scabichelini]NGO15313.1 TetR/AcrR family transcriptional regulator [Streptomyces scabichelini]
MSAAASVLARDRAATLADIAVAADVGRSTLHRHFSDREELVRAAVRDSIEVLAGSVAGASVDEGSPLEAMRRLVAALVDVGDRLLFLFGDPRVLQEYGPQETGDDQSERSVLDLIERGQAEGVLDPGVSPDWILNVLYALVYTGIEGADRRILPRHGVVPNVIRTLENGIVRGAPEGARARAAEGER